MKKRFLPLCLSAGLAAIVWAAAAGGGADDPLASLSYLNGTFTVAVDKRVDAALDASDALLRERAENGETAGSAALWQEVRLKEGDALQGVTGTGALLLAGSAQVIYASGAVVDVTTGSVVPDGAPLYRHLQDRRAGLSGAVRLHLFRPAGLQRHGRCSEVSASFQGHLYRLRIGL